VGGIINWGTDDATVNPWGASISAYDASNDLLDEVALSDSGVNLLSANTFYAFLDNTPDISRFVLTDGFIGLRDLTVVTPLPPALLLFASGLGTMGWLARRKALLPSA
jgi:hypothetical protein